MGTAATDRIRWGLLAAVVFLWVACEVTCVRAGAGCTSHQFSCANGRCVPLSWTCDKEDDCGDGSDEREECKENATCNSTEYRCKDGRCLPARWQCDGEQDCEDGSDEAEELCAERTCGVEEWTCQSGKGQCIPMAWVCDEHEDCDDASDEQVCNQTCTATEFTCANSKCVQKRWLCDQEDDCGDGSDEDDCPVNECDGENEFACGDGYCVTRRWRCDGDMDCPDASDEKDCDDFWSKSGNGSTNASGLAGSADNGTVGVGVPPSCASTEFQCLDKFYCVHHSWVCDGEEDCPDGSDEDEVEQCGTKTKCRSDQFQCAADGLCIPGHLQCSGSAECKDGSDEVNCKSASLGCNSTQLDCFGDGTMCLHPERVCDGVNDCGDWEDEPKGECGVNECAANNGGCEQRCVDLKVGRECRCKAGYKMSDHDGTSCQDVNECLIPGTCSQRCVNRPGGFKCACLKGYLNDPRDRTRCRASEGRAALLFAHKTDIRRIALDRSGINDLTTIVNETRSSCAVDYVFKMGMVFWSDVMTQKLYKAPIDEGHKKIVVIENNIVTSDGLACDWIYGHLFWSDTGTNSIMMSDFDGKMIATVITDHLEEPRAIAVYPEKGWLFWSDWGENPRIERAGMDGSHRSVIVDKSVRWPNGIALDLASDRIYWVDAKLNLVGSADLDGANSRVVFSSSEILRHPFSITVFEDWLYWSDWDSNAIYRANKFNGSGASPVTATNMKQIPMVVHVYHPYRQPETTNHCLPLNGRCSHICLPAPQFTKRSAKTACFCPDGMRIGKDNLNCEIDPTAKTTPSPPTFSDGSDRSLLSSSLRREHEGGIVTGVAVGAIACVMMVTTLIGMAVYRRFVYQSLHTINFDNPVYRKTTSSSSASGMSAASGEQLNSLSTVLTSASTLTHLSSLTSSSHLTSTDPLSDDSGGGGEGILGGRVTTASTTLHGNESEPEDILRVLLNQTMGDLRDAKDQCVEPEAEPLTTSSCDDSVIELF